MRSFNGPKELNICEAQTSIRSRPSWGSPTAVATMSMGKNVANSVMAQNVPLDTNLSTNRSAFDVISSCSDFSAVGLSGFPMTRRERLWSEPSLRSVFPRSTGSYGRSS